MSSTWRPVDIALAAASVFVSVAAFLPWARLSAGIFSVSKDGIEGDGVITLVAALLVAAVILMFVYGRLPERSMLIIVTIGGIAITGVGVYDWIKLEDLDTDSSALSVSPGAGLILTVIGGVALALVAGSRLSARRAPPL